MNNKATVMISTLVGDSVHERIILPEFPYLTDENGGISLVDANAMQLKAS